MVRLLEEFGDSEDVLDAVGASIRSYFGWGSPAEYYALHEALLSRLRDDHPSERVRRWSRAMAARAVRREQGDPKCER